MEPRDIFLKEFRGEKIGSVGIQSTSEEIFQNEVLRPILKLQNDLLLASFRNYSVKYKNTFSSLTSEKKLAAIENAIQKDIKYRNTLKGMVVGLFTEQEYLFYSKNTSNLNKRMMSMLIERIKSQVQLLE